jgi:hypothetical protein
LQHKKLPAAFRNDVLLLWHYLNTHSSIDVPELHQHLCDLDDFRSNFFLYLGHYFIYYALAV